MPVAPFTHLNVASAYSAHYGVCWPEELAQAAAADDATALACTDRDGLYGIVKHVAACQKYGLAPILGVNLQIIGHGRVTVLAEGYNEGAGYRLLCGLVSLLHQTPRGKPISPVGISFETFCQFLSNEVDLVVGEEGIGLTVLLGPDSDVGALLAERHYRAGIRALHLWKQRIPAQRLSVEVVYHLTAPGERLSISHAVRMVKAAKEIRLPAILTNAVRYRESAEAVTADVLDAARTLTSLATLKDLQNNAQGWLKPATEMSALAAEIAHHAGYGAYTARRLLEKTEQLAQNCILDPESDLGWGKPVIPELSLLGIAENPHTALVNRSWEGLARRYPDAFNGSVLKDNQQQLASRLKEELSTITSLDFSGFFLTVAHVCDLIRKDQIRHAARGSGASSLVNYVLGISDVDPIEHNLVFERFLSPQRSSLPDIDIDVESARRHDVYHAIFKHFGSERVSLMSMQNGYRVRGAVRDAGMALGMDTSEVDTIAKQMWRFPASSFREALEKMPELQPFRQRLLEDRSKGHQQLDLLVDITERLDRLPRHISMHPCGVILSDQTLLHRTPVQPSGMGLPMSQFDKHDMDPMGMLKLDVLGVRMQSTIAYAIKEIERTTGNTLEIEKVPYNDEETYKLIQSTHTLGCFQIESPGQRELIGKLVPQKFNDLIIDISLFRPGPMQSDMVRPFLEQRHGWAKATYPHPNLKPVLEETHGIVVFHEQVLKIISTMTGASLSLADEHRRALGTAEQIKVEEYFRKHALQRGYNMDVIDTVWQTIEAFGSFGFCKAHGAAFAVPTYYSAWLKAHHPEAFMAAVFEHDPGMYPRRLMVAEAKRMGISILGLDINASTDHFRVETTDTGEQGIRMSLSMLAGLSNRELNRIIKAQPFSSFTDLQQRAKPSKRSMERLIRVGALDSLYEQEGPEHREHLLNLLYQQHTSRGSEVAGQLALPFTTAPEIQQQVQYVDRVPYIPSLESTLKTELDLLGSEISGHLMDHYKPLLNMYGVSWAEDLLKLHSQSRVLVAGIRVATQTPPMRKGKRVVFLSLDDGTGCVDCAFFTEAQHNSGPLLFGTSLLLVEGYTRRTGPAGISIQAERAWDLQDPANLPPTDLLMTSPLEKKRDCARHSPIPVPHPETWQLLPTPRR